MNKPNITELETLLNKVTDGLENITSKKMFGCHAVWANDNVFALVWKQGRIGFKLPDPKHYEKLMSLTGSAPWKAGPMQMAHWVLVPESFHNKLSEIKKWALTSYELCSQLENKGKEKNKKSKPSQ